MNRYVVDLDAHHERASATPDGPARAPRASAPSASPAADRVAVDASLVGAQRWLIDAITRPEVVGLSDARARLTDGPRLTALERLDIYRRGYRSRLVECLADDYPVLRHALGPARFDDLCDVYLERFPSQSPSLNHFGRHMEALCREGPRPLPSPGALYANLAALEWAVVEVVHAPSAPPLTAEGLGGIADDAWPGARLVANTAVRLRRFAFPVNAYFQAVREDRDPPLPGPADSATVVYRSGSAVWRMDLTAPMHAVLAGLLSGEALGVALARAEEGLAGLDDASIVARVTSWFGEWVGSGLFVAVTSDDDRGGGDDG